MLVAVIYSGRGRMNNSIVRPRRPLLLVIGFALVVLLVPLAIALWSQGTTLK